MRRLTAMLMIGLLLPLTAHAQRRRAVMPADSSLSISFVDDLSTTAMGSDAWLDLKNVTHSGQRDRTKTTITRHVGVRVLRNNGAASGSATITARLQTADSRAELRIDGRRIGVTPTVIDARAPIGRTTTHTIDIDVPSSAPEGPLAFAITWEVTGN